MFEPFPSRRRFVLAFAAALCAAPLLCAAKEATAAKDAPHALKFDKESHATAKAKLKAPGDVVHVYTIDLAAAGTYMVTLDDKKAGVAYFNVFAPGAPQHEGEGRTRQEVKATAAGAYTIRVFMTRSAVDKGVAASYVLTVAKP